MKKFIIPLAIFIINIVILKNTFDINNVLCKVLIGTSCLYSLLLIIDYKITLPVNRHDLAALSYFQLFIFNTYFSSDTTDIVAIFILLNVILSTFLVIEKFSSLFCEPYPKSMSFFINIISLSYCIPFATNAIILNKIFWLETTSHYEKLIYILAYILFSKILINIILYYLSFLRKISNILNIFFICNQVAILIISIIMKIKLPDTSLFYIISSSIGLITFVLNRIEVIKEDSLYSRYCYYSGK